jgi:hypothetical protein
MTDDAGTGDTDWHEARNEALATLRDALRWELPERRWEQVDDAMDGMATAFAAANSDALWQMTGYLELCSPLRVATRLGDTPALPAPKPTQDRIAEMIDALTRAGDRKPGDRPDLGPQAPA